MPCTGHRKPLSERKTQRTTVELSGRVGELLDAMRRIDLMPSRAAMICALIEREAQRRGISTEPAPLPPPVPAVEGDA